MAVELGGQSTLPLHLPAQVEGAAPGAILPAVDHVAPTALAVREGDNENRHENNKERLRGEQS